MIVVYIASAAYAAASFEYNRRFRKDSHFHQLVSTFGVLFFVISVLPGAFISTHLVSVQGVLGRYIYPGEAHLREFGWEPLRIPVGRANLSAAYYAQGGSKWIILLPALDRSFTNYLFMLKKLSTDLDANALAFDYRGVGSSHGEVKRALDLISDGQAAVEEVVRRFRALPENIILYGHNGGGIVAVSLGCPGALVVVDRSYARFSGMVTESTSSYALLILFLGACAYDAGYEKVHKRRQRQVEDDEGVEDLDGILVAAIALTFVQIGARLFSSLVPYVIGGTVIYISTWLGMKDYVLFSQYRNHWWIGRVILPLLTAYVLKTLFKKTLLDILLIPVFATLAVVGIDADRWYIWLENKVFWAFFVVYLLQVSDIASTVIIAYGFELDLVKSLRKILKESILGNVLVMYDTEDIKQSSSAIVQLKRNGMLNTSSIHTIRLAFNVDDPTRALLHQDVYQYSRVIEKIKWLMS